MKFCEYLRILRKYIGGKRNQGDFMIYITTLFLIEPQTKNQKKEDDRDTFNPLHAKKRRTLEKYFTGERKITSADAQVLLSRFSSREFERELVSLKTEIQKSLIKEMKEYNVKSKINNFEKVCSKLYKDFLETLINGSDILEDYQITFKKIEKNDLVSTSEEYTLEAIAFCKEFEGELKLIPLCMISDNLNPLRNNERSLYNKFSLCSSLTKKEILRLTKNDEIIFKNDWVNRCLELYKKDLDENKFGERTFLYEGAKYLHGALEYAEIKPRYMDPNIFDVLYKSKRTKYKKSTITMYIKKYLYDNEKNDMEPPLEYIWEKAELETCDPELMSFWVMRFIISSCYQLPLGKYSENLCIEEQYLDTFEDMYYYTLLELYTRYGDSLK